ncbi:LysR family transcriptional regulator, partial [Xylophilus sp. Kf1]|nr:LysR family transcriptional regulator [Xylophilus sp. Kf1]
VPKSHPLAMTVHPPLSQFTNQSLYCLEPMTSSIKSKLIEKTKAQVRMISDMKLAQHILSHNKGFIISSQNSLLYDHVNWTKIPLNHTELKRMLCVVMRKDNKKNDINIAWNLICTLLNKSTIY